MFFSEGEPQDPCVKGRVEDWEDYGEKSGRGDISEERSREGIREGIEAEQGSCAPNENLESAIDK
jgi:hypothetical protein